MSRLMIFLVLVLMAVGAYFLVTRPEPTPSEQLQSAAEDVGEAVSEAASSVQDAANDAADAVTEQASDAASSVADQATEAASDAGDQVATAVEQGQDLLATWIEEGKLTAQQFDYDAMVSSVQDSALSQEIKTQAVAILDDIKAAPETLVVKISELRTLLSQQ